MGLVLPNLDPQWKVSMVYKSHFEKNMLYLQRLEWHFFPIFRGKLVHCVAFQRQSLPNHLSNFPEI